MIHKARQPIVITNGIGTFVMHIGGDDVDTSVWPDGFFVHVTVDCKNAKLEDLIFCALGGQSFRVKIQAILRKKSIADLKHIRENGYKCNFSDVWNAPRATVTVIKVTTLQQALEIAEDENMFVEAATASFGDLVTEKQLRVRYQSYLKTK